MALVIDLGPRALDPLPSSRLRLRHALQRIDGVRAAAVAPDPTIPTRSHAYLVAAPDVHLPTLHRNVARRLAALNMATTIVHIRPTPP